VINPGALAPGGPVTRQRHKTVALLSLKDSEPPLTTHVDLAAPGEPFEPAVDLAAGFRAAHDQYEPSILAADLEARYPYVRDHAATLDEPLRDRLREALLRLSWRCWTDQQPWITRDEMIALIESTPGIPPATRASLLATLGE
jgi:hypothetical protein